MVWVCVYWIELALMHRPIVNAVVHAPTSTICVVYDECSYSACAGGGRAQGPAEGVHALRHLHHSRYGS